MGEQYENNLRSFLWLAAVLFLLMLILLILSIVLTNRFLTRFMFRRIEEPLTLLTDGVAKVSADKLDISVAYERSDEFRPVFDAFNDMTKRLLTASEQSAAEEQRRRELFAGISHDLRSPLTSVRAYTEALLDGVAKTPEDTRRYLTKIRLHEAEIEHMVEALFLYTKMELKDYPVHWQRLELRSELFRIWEENPSDGHLTVDLSALPPFAVLADPFLLERIILNLLDNSRKYRRGETAHVRITASRTENGILLSVADSVPGVSGGTVAFFVGEYDSFIGAFGNLLGKARERHRQSLRFLLRLGIGWLCGMALSVTLLAGLSHTHIYVVSSLFLGLVAASIPLVAVEEKATLRACRPRHLLCFAVGAAAVVGLSLLHFSPATETLDILSALYVFISGALAILAMVLPGISGSTLLLAFGLYVPIITGLKRFFALDLSAFPLLFVFGLGVLTGIFCSFKGIHYLLKRYRPAMLAAILGLMTGSLFAVVMGPTTLTEPLSPLSPANWHPFSLLIGILIVAGFAAAKAWANKRRASYERNHPAA